MTARRRSRTRPRDPLPPQQRYRLVDHVEDLFRIRFAIERAEIEMILAAGRRPIADIRDELDFLRDMEREGIELAAAVMPDAIHAFRHRMGEALH